MMRKRKQKVLALKGKDKKKRKKGIDLIECLQLPRHVGQGMEMATVCGDREISLRCFKQIQKADSREVIVSARCHTIRICGENLELAYYTRDEVKISGRIVSISYEKR